MSIALLSLFSICLGYLEGIGRLSSNQRMNCFRRNIALSSLKFHRKMTFYLSLSLFLYNQSDHLFLTADKQTRIYNQTKPNRHRHPLDPNSPTSTSFPTQHPPELRLRSAESPSSSRQLRSLHRAVRSTSGPVAARGEPLPPAGSSPGSSHDSEDEAEQVEGRDRCGPGENHGHPHCWHRGTSLACDARVSPQAEDVWRKPVYVTQWARF